MIWKILKIEPTKDKDKITNTYRTLLKKTNPEDKPEEFKQLREAYEKALEYAKKEKRPSSSPIDSWMNQVMDVYKDFPKRINAQVWQELLKDPICSGIDTKPYIEEALLSFLMGNWFLPHEIWQILNQTFAFEERVDELCAKFNPDFIQYALLSGIRYEDNLPYTMFEPGLDGKDCDTFRMLFNRANNTYGEEYNEILDEMDELSETHPYGQIMRLRTFLDTERDGLAQREITKLYHRYPDNIAIGSVFVQMCLEKDRILEAKEAATHLNELHPFITTYPAALAECEFKQGDKLEAKNMLFDLMDRLGSDNPEIPNLLKKLNDWNELLIDQ